MPRYCFHLTGGFVDNDQDGVELANLGTARLETLKFASAYLSDNPKIVWEGNEFRVEVTDDQGKVLQTVLTLAVDAPSERSTIKS